MHTCTRTHATLTCNCLFSLGICMNVQHKRPKHRHVCCSASNAKHTHTIPSDDNVMIRLLLSSAKRALGFRYFDNVIFFYGRPKRSAQYAAANSDKDAHTHNSSTQSHKHYIYLSAVMLVVGAQRWHFAQCRKPITSIFNWTHSLRSVRTMM